MIVPMVFRWVTILTGSAGGRFGSMSFVRSRLAAVFDLKDVERHKGGQRQPDLTANQYFAQPECGGD